MSTVGVPTTTINASIKFNKGALYAAVATALDELDMSFEEQMRLGSAITDALKNREDEPGFIQGLLQVRINQITFND